MGIDPLKRQGPPVVSAPAETAPVDTPAAEPPPDPDGPAPGAEGFDDPKQKLVSVTGGFVAHKPDFPVRDDLKAFVDAQRGVGAVKSKPLQDTTLQTASNTGAGPGPRAATADFMAQAKAAAKPNATPDEIEASAVALGKAALTKDFGFNVKDGNQKWSPEDLSRAYESFSKMPSGDQAKLKGLDLIRNKEAPPESQAEAKGGGTVAGEYNPNSDTKDGVRLKNGSITLYNAAFPNPTKSDDASRQTTMHVVIHESGHAVEGRARDDAAAALGVASDKLNTANDALQKTIDGPKQPWADLTTAAKGFSYSDAAGEKFARKQEAVDAAVSKLQDATTPKQVTDAQAAITKAKGERDTALAKLSGNKSESAAKDWVAASDAVEPPVNAYVAAHVPFLAAKKDVDTATAKVKTVATDGDGATSKELEAFTKMKGKEDSVSTYGGSAGPEGYAEAYALYQRDPKLMKKDFPNQYKYFHQNHKSPNDP